MSWTFNPEWPPQRRLNNRFFKLCVPPLQLEKYFTREEVGFYLLALRDVVIDSNYYTTEKQILTAMKRRMPANRNTVPRGLIRALCGAAGYRKIQIAVGQSMKMVYMGLALAPVAAAAKPGVTANAAIE